MSLSVGSSREKTALQTPPQILDDFIGFLNRCPTVYNAAKEIAARLAQAGFTELREGEKWKLEAGKGYFILRQDALLAAFRLPKKLPSSAIVLASHIDSPC